MSEEREHAEFSPSSLQNYAACAAFTPLNRGPGRAAKRGTAMHDAMELDDKSGLDEYEGYLVDWVNEKLKDLLPFERTTKMYTIYEEVHLNILNGLTFGWVDFLALPSATTQWVPNTATAYLVDYKFGELPVIAPERNLQMQAYVLGVFENYKHVDQVHTTILQPKLREMKSYIFSREQVPQLSKTIAVVIEMAKTAKYTELKDDEFFELYAQPGYQCQYCALNTSCPKLRYPVQQLAMGYNEKLKLPERYHPSELQSPEQIAIGLQLVPILRKWCDSMMYHAQQKAIDEGISIPGYKVVTQKGRRKLEDTARVKQLLVELFDWDFSDQEFLALCNLSISDLETLVKNKSMKGEKQKEVDRLKEHLEAHDLVSTGKPITKFVKEK